MKKIFFISAFVIAFFIPAESFAWSMTGHRVIAELAQRNIKKNTHKKINELLDGLPMAYWTNWPDFIKSDKTGEWDHTHIWHYVNAPGNLTESQFVDYIGGVKQDNLYSVIPQLVNTIKDKKSSREECRIALIFIIHLIGDAHQPMHVGREEDLGGNKVPLTWFNSPTNLHAVWDGKLIDYEKYSYTEYTDILNIMPDNVKKEYRRGSLERWLYESHILANELYEGVNEGDNLMFEYSYKYKAVTEKQLQKAGMRLAAVLDMAFN